MQKRSVEAIVRALNDAGVRYMIAGGLAVVAHGYLRFTADVDLILDLNESNTRRALGSLSGLGYRPRAPVAIDEFADADARASWIRDKGLRVFSLQSSTHPGTEVDLFAESPLDFEKAYHAAVHLDVAPGVTAAFVGFDDLVAMKNSAGRAQDITDIQQLRAIRKSDAT